MPTTALSNQERESGRPREKGEGQVDKVFLDILGERGARALLPDLGSDSGHAPSLSYQTRDEKEVWMNAGDARNGGRVK